MGSVRQFVSLVFVCQFGCHQNFGLITTTKGLNPSKRHSNNDNSEKIVHGVPEAVLFSRGRSHVPRLRNQTGDETIVAEDTRR